MIPNPIRSISTVKKMTPRRERLAATRQRALELLERLTRLRILRVELKPRAQLRRGLGVSGAEEERARQVEVRRPEARADGPALPHRRDRPARAPTRHHQRAEVEVGQRV